MLATIDLSALESGTSILKMSPISKFCHQHPKIVTNIKSPTSTCYQHLCRHQSPMSDSFNVFFLFSPVVFKISVCPVVRWTIKNRLFRLYQIRHTADSPSDQLLVINGNISLLIVVLLVGPLQGEEVVYNILSVLQYCKYLMILTFFLKIVVWS